MNEFDILAAKVMAGEATPAEASRLRELLAGNPALKPEYAGLLALSRAVTEVLPSCAEEEESPPTIPSDRLRMLLGAVRRHASGTTGKAATGSMPESSSEATSIAGPRSHHRHPQTSWTVRWMNRLASIAPRMALAAVTLTTGAILLWIAYRPPQAVKAPASYPSAPAAFLLVSRGAVDVVRAGGTAAVEFAYSLLPQDQIALGPDAKAFLELPGGTLTLVGPTNSAVPSIPGVSAPADRGGNTESLRGALWSDLRREDPPRLLAAARSAGRIAVYSPLGATASQAPTLLWKAEPGKTYAAQITDELDSSQLAMTVAGVLPPLRFELVESWKNRSLTPGHLYRLRLAESGAPLSVTEVTFRVIETPVVATPEGYAEQLVMARSLLEASPERIGDVLTILLQLPSEYARSEVTRRLKLAAFARLGYVEDYDRVLAEIRSSE